MHHKSIRTLKNGIATPMLVNFAAHTFCGAIYDEHRDLVHESQRTINGKNEWNPDDPLKYTESLPTVTLKGRSIYLGHYTGHYGHFLLETLSRFWHLLSPEQVKQYDHFVFHPFLHDTPNPRTFSPAKICLDAFGIATEKVSFISNSTIFERIDVPAPMFEINHKADPVMAKVYEKLKRYSLKLNTSSLGLIQRLKGWPQQGDLKIYISRRKAKGYHPIENDRDVEGVFASHGFKIFHPEKWGFEKQIAIFDRASVLAGTEGSAMHNSVFMRSGTHLLTIGTPRFPSGRILNQDLCNVLSGVHNHYIHFKGIETINFSAIYDEEYLKNEIAEVLRMLNMNF
jgi:hypothetical protein